MTLTRQGIGLGLCVCLALLPGCGGDDDDDDATADTVASDSGDDDAGDDDTGDDDTTDETVTDAGGELPTFFSEFDRVCTTQVGYPGAASYEPTAGVHPVALFENFRDEGTYVQSSVTLPEGWTVTEDSDFEDNSEFEAVELVACADRVEETPTGIDCEFEEEGEDPISLELVDTVWEVTVYRATSGEPVDAAVSIEAAATDCPFVVAYEQGDTQYFIDPDEDQLTNALKPFVAL